MATWRHAVELAMTEEEIGTLSALSRSRSEPASRVSRAAMLLAYRENPSFFAVARRLGAHHQTVQRCVERAVAYGALAALDDRPRPGKAPAPRDRESLMGSMEDFIHYEKLIIFKRRLADPTITDKQRQMLTRLLALVPETDDTLSALGGHSESAL